MAISLKQKIAEEIANLLANKVYSVVVYFTDGTFLNATTTNNAQFDEANNCYYANISFAISLTAAKTINKIEFYNANNELLFIDNGNIADNLNAGDNYITRKLKITYAR